MAFLDLAQNSSSFVRQTTTLTNTPVSGSTSVFGSSYVLLNVTVNNPCRIRLYSDSASVAIDDSRSTASINLDPAVGLVVDTLITSQSYTLNFDPPIIGTTFSGSTTWYNISGSNVSATFTYFPIEINDADREVLTFELPSVDTLPAAISNNIASPKAFLLLSASCNYSESRLRLYSKDVNTISGTETSRNFGTAPDNQDNLIIDMVFDSASYAYKLTPTLQAFNLDTYEAGQNFVGYIFQNLSTSTMTDVTASLYIYPLED